MDDKRRNRNGSRAIWRDERGEKSELRFRVVDMNLPDKRRGHNRSCVAEEVGAQHWAKQKRGELVTADYSFFDLAGSREEYRRLSFACRAPNFRSWKFSFV